MVDTLSTIVAGLFYPDLMTGGYDPMHYGNWLREELRRRDWTPSRLAREIGVPRTTVTRWLNGERRIQDGHARRVGRALGVDERLSLYHAGYVSEGDSYPVELQLGDVLQDVVRRLDNVRQLEEELQRRTRRVDVWGRVPADTIRDTQDEGLEPVDVAASTIQGARSPFGLLVVGECMMSIGIYPGDVLICDRDADRTPKDGELVVVRLHEGVTFKRWCVVDDLRVELRDGDGAVAHTINALMDEYIIEGYYITFQPLAPR